MIQYRNVIAFITPLNDKFITCYVNKLTTTSRMCPIFLSSSMTRKFKKPVIVVLVEDENER